VAAELDLAQSTVSWHTSKMADQGCIEKSTTSPMMVSLAKPERTAELIESVSPSLPDRLVDRFVRTVDSFLE
jgi:hypothetical protein